MAVIMPTYVVQSILESLNKVVAASDKMSGAGMYFPASFDAKYARDKFVECLVTDIVAEQIPAPSEPASADVVALATAAE